ncbi:MAG TPA: hypothetical protein VK625_06890 [Flavitalea sp.]|nr:hypothetical protein [Flavitalea sp.]
MKRIFLSLVAITVISATLLADGGKTPAKAKTECSQACCDACGSTCTCK